MTMNYHYPRMWFCMYGNCAQSKELLPFWTTNAPFSIPLSKPRALYPALHACCCELTL